MNPETDTIIILPEETGERLDKILAKRFEERQSRTYFQQLIEDQLVLLNGLPVKKRIKPAAGDEVEIHFILTPEMNVSPEPIPLDILYEDDHLLVVNKPPGMVVHPAPGHWTGTFVNALLHHCQGLNTLGDPLRPGIVHRLDKGTSGVLLAAKTTWALQRLIEAFSSRRIRKEYIAICQGNPGNVDIREKIGRHPVDRKRMAIIEEGKEALSQCRTVSTNGKLSIVHVVLVTGRTHQIRVHLQYQKTPILGDETYGNPQSNKIYGFSRPLLHAEKLSFEHPVTGVKVECVAPMPQDMVKIMHMIQGKRK